MDIVKPKIARFVDVVDEKTLAGQEADSQSKLAGP